MMIKPILTLKSSPLRLMVLPLLAVLAACSPSDDRNRQPSAEDFESLSAQFAEPSREYGSAPLFVWNKIVTPERIDEAMTDLKAKGFGGVFVHPRPGMVTPYLDDNWFALFRHTVEKGRELDMNVWIYDENSYPSGFAGGKVPAQGDIFRMKHLMFSQEAEKIPEDEVKPLDFLNAAL